MNERLTDELNRREQDVYLLKEEKRLKSSIEKVREQLPQYSSSLLRCLLGEIEHDALLELTVALGRTMSLIVQVQGIPYILVYDYLFYDKSLKKTTKRLYKQFSKQHKPTVKLKTLYSEEFQQGYAHFVEGLYNQYYKNKLFSLDGVRQLVEELKKSLH